MRFMINNLWQSWTHFMNGIIYLNCQACWNSSLSHFDFTIMYQPKPHQGIIKGYLLFDTLLRQSYLVPKKTKKHMINNVEFFSNLKHFRLRAIGREPLFHDQIYKTSCSNTLILKIKQQVNNNCNELKLVDDLLYFQEQLWISKGLICLGILEAHHDFLATGHFKFNRTLDLEIFCSINCGRFWKKLSCLVLFVLGHHLLCNVLQPLFILKQMWSFVSIYFITNLPL